jgi:pyruvate/2-oxoglutarate dehydrogenase complex dihydrolipoamide dehydrogenase (E3) component
MHPLREPLDPHDRRLVEHVHPPNWRNPEPRPIYDLVVIGGGTAGLVCAAGAATLGARVALVERGLLGGDCLNTGCVPSKTLLRSARAVHEARDGVSLGIPTTAEVDFAAVMTRLRARRAEIAPHDSAERLASLGAHVFFGSAAFTGPATLAVDGETLSFRRAVIATGSRPTIPSALAAREGTPQADPPHTYTSDTIFSIVQLPAELIVIGAGPLGCELAQAFALLGTRVTLTDAATRVLPQEDPDAAAIVARSLVRAGVEIVTGSDPRFQPAAGKTVLAATGRSPNVEGLRLEVAGVKYDARGVHVDDRLRTSNRRIYAAGDICSPFKFTHAADAMARIVIQNALFFGRRRTSDLVIPWCTYTLPEVAHVGASAEDARRQHAETVTIPLGDVDRAIVDHSADGFVRVHHQQGRIAGATIVAPHAGELIGYLASTMRRRANLADFSSEIFPYPTVADALRKAGDAYRRTSLSPGIRRALGRYFALLRRT